MGKGHCCPGGLSAASALLVALDVLLEAAWFTCLTEIRYFSRQASSTLLISCWSGPYFSRGSAAVRGESERRVVWPVARQEWRNAHGVRPAARPKRLGWSSRPWRRRLRGAAASSLLDAFSGSPFTDEQPFQTPQGAPSSKDHRAHWLWLEAKEGRRVWAIHLIAARRRGRALSHHAFASAARLSLIGLQLVGALGGPLIEGRWRTGVHLSGGDRAELTDPQAHAYALDLAGRIAGLRPPRRNLSVLPFVVTNRREPIHALKYKQIVRTKGEQDGGWSERLRRSGLAGRMPY